MTILEQGASEIATLPPPRQATLVPPLPCTTVLTSTGGLKDKAPRHGDAKTRRQTLHARHYTPDTTRHNKTRQAHSKDDATRVALEAHHPQQESLLSHTTQPSGVAQETPPSPTARPLSRPTSLGNDVHDTKHARRRQGLRECVGCGMWWRQM